MFKKYDRSDPSPDIDYIVKEIIINSIIKVDNTITNIEDIPMRQATQLEYNIIDEYKNCLQNNPHQASGTDRMTAMKTIHIKRRVPTG